jgi:hypothetical protein
MYGNLVKQLIGEKEKPQEKEEKPVEIRDTPYWTYAWCPSHGVYDILDGEFCNCMGAFTYTVLWLRGSKLMRTRPPFMATRHRPNGKSHGLEGHTNTPYPSPPPG